MNVWVHPYNTNLDLGVRYRFVLSFQSERMNHLKTNCFEHTNMEPRYTDLHVNSFDNFIFVRGTYTHHPTPPIWR